MSTKPIGSLPPATPSSQRGVRVLMLLLTFLGGGIAGAVGGAMHMQARMTAFMRHPERIPDRIIPGIRSRLALTSEQARAVEEIIRRRHRSMEMIRAETHPRQLAQFEGMCDEVAGILTEQQREKWAAICQSVRKNYMPVPPASLTQ